MAVSLIPAATTDAAAAAAAAPGPAAQIIKRHEYNSPGLTTY